MQKLFVFALALALLGAPVSAREESGGGQASTSGSNKGKVIGTIAGAAGGFVLGIFAGLNWFDDATDSDRKVWTTAIAFGAAGGVGGYFAGRALGRSQTTFLPSIRRAPDAASLPQGIRLRQPTAAMPSRAANARLAAVLSGN